MNLEMVEELNCQKIASQEQINPFLIPHIVDKILNHLPIPCPDLFQFRLVCKQWAQSASEILRSTKKVRIGHCFTNVEKLARLLKISRRSDFFPVANFVLNQDTFTDANSHLIKDVFLVFSPVLESLCIWMDLKSALKFDNDSFFLKEKVFQSLRFPKLRKLIVDDQRCVSLMNYPFEDSGPKLLFWLVTSSPNLEQLSLRFDREFDSNNLEHGGAVQKSVLRLLGDEEVGKLFRNLKCLQLDIHLSDVLLKRLSETFSNSPKMPHLNTLRLIIKESRFGLESFQRLLSTLRNRLEVLSLVFLTSKSSVEIQFPRMNALKRLEIDGLGKVFPNVHFHPILYQQQLPSLETLILNSCGESFDGRKLNSNQPVVTLQELKFTGEVITVEHFHIAKTFPNLKRLDIKITTEHLKIFQAIFEKLSQLVSLKVRSWTSNNRNVECDGNIDHIMTGIPIDICDMLRQNRYYFDIDISPQLNPHFSQIKKNLKDFQEGRGLTNLKYLKRLELQDLSHIGEISDITGYLAFMEMTALEYLDVDRSMMSRPCVQTLATKFPLNMKQRMQAWTSNKGIRNGLNEQVTINNWVMVPVKCNYL